MNGGDKIYPADIISSILVSAFNRIYLGLEGNGFVELNKATGKITRIPLAEKPPFVRNILQYSPDELWIGTESGIYIYNIVSGSVQNLVSSPHDQWSLSDNAIHSLCKDRDGGIWIGTFFGGVNYLPQRTPDFNKFYYNDKEGGLKGRRIRRICPDGKGNLWIATEDAGLFNFDPQTGVFRHLPQSEGFTNVQTLMMDGDNLWIGTFSKGIKILNTKTGDIRTFEFVKEHLVRKIHGGNYRTVRRIEESHGLFHCIAADNQFSRIDKQSASLSCDGSLPDLCARNGIDGSNLA